ncbi:type II toxin-antitoxin system Phd/YefM family antitoxin [Selenomonas dianae]|uniref:Antitoxin n=1 Tax=Selenomonas dianae TaxID=135079 RepID=A0ABN0SZW8_9FIRM|nr:type II toxin-antitoxin system prevent-host-death family antitoxin [Selenomonas dianae]WLD82290.1 type II toxin-antitoxin system prevent-host-death family antitoxin [Selenomonas dianae]
MVAVNFSTLRSNLKSYCDAATRDAETIIVTRRNEENVVLMSFENYNNLVENVFLMSDRHNYAHIVEGIAQLRAGCVTEKSSEELARLLDE